MEIRKAVPADWPAWRSLDRHIAEKRFLAKTEAGECLVAVDEEQNVQGILRWSWFWDEIPFVNLLFVRDGQRGCGMGKALMLAFEEEARKEGVRLVLTSTQVNEEAQHFYRRLGYRDCGGFLLPEAEPVPLELMLCRELDS